MVPDLTNIHLFADTHAVEVMSFSVILGVSIDHADIRRFDDEIENVKEVFPSITSPDMIQIAIGPSEQNPPPPPVPVKDLNLN